MTYATEKVKIGRRPLTVVEIDLDTCTLNYGGGLLSPVDGACVATHTGSPATGTQKCWNTRATCQDTTNYTIGTKTYRFVENQAELPVGIAWHPCLRSVDIAPTKINPGKGLGDRASVTVKLQDFPHHDRGVDPYILEATGVSGRSYTAENTNGTFFGRLFKRTPYYQGRTLRVRSGYIGATFAWTDFQDRTYLIESVTGPDSRGNVTIVAKDPLKKMDGDRAVCPVVCKGALTANITDVYTTGLTLDTETDWTKYPATDGYLRINDEIIKYGTKAVASPATSATFTTLTRAQGGSTAAAHELGDNAQMVKVWTAANVVAIIHELLTTDTDTAQEYGGLPTAYMPYGVSPLASNAWEAERDKWLSGRDFTRYLSEPTAVKDLLEELTAQAQLYIWWDEIASEVQLKALAPPIGTLTAITETSNVLADSLKVRETPKDRLSQVWVYHQVINYTQDVDGPENFTTITAVVDSDAEGVAEYDERRIRRIYSPWIANAGAAIQLASRTLHRYRDNPQTVTFTMDAKDSALWTGDPFDLTHESLPDFTGAAATIRLQVTSVKETPKGLQYSARSFPFAGRYAFVAANGTVDYTAATNKDDSDASWVCENDDADFSDGGKAYKVP